ncbi:hypothetical protein PAASB05_06825 [Pantoea agglomerans]|uniref:hypothetical protein n=1 Tax=Enterobacter agglomerans TaxID=549 RepID=UPI0013022B57|nr:hypothetical protein [Pantoea agglomerans]QGY57620.1 hypothetical protein PAASB05_06825 [Pantoea agglomerans]
MLNIISEFKNKFNNIIDVISRLENKVTSLDEKVLSVDAKVENLNHKIASIDDKFDAVNEEKSQLIPVEIDQADDKSAVIEQLVHNLQDRLEFVREEFMFELRLKTGTLTDRDNKKEIETKIISSDKFDNLGWRKINIGCGHVQPEGYINVDARELPGVDVICSASDLVFDDEALEEIYAAHLIEHFTELELTRVIFPHWYKKLKTGGVLKLVTPDADSMIKDYVSGTMSFDDLRKVTYGAQDYEGDFHYIMFSVDSLKKMLTDAGFTTVTLVEDNRKNGLCREMEVLAIK